MRHGQRWLMNCLGLGMLLSATTGCLSLGGSTTYVDEKPETAGRISALETRVSALEQAFSGGAQATTITSGSLSDQ